LESVPDQVVAQGTIQTVAERHAEQGHPVNNGQQKRDMLPKLHVPEISEPEIALLSRLKNGFPLNPTFGQ